jgi:adenylate cyclase class IV
VRIRLAEGKKPRLELKEFSHAHAWHETHFHIDGPAHFVKLLSKIMVPRRILEKRRETWSNGPIEICVDDVRHLGRFIEIEGSELEVKEMAIALGFRLEDHQANYGSQLFYLEKTGFISFHQEDMEAVLKEFS